jgi:hypothetical protein
LGQRGTTGQAAAEKAAPRKTAWARAGIATGRHLEIDFVAKASAKASAKAGVDRPCPKAE